MFKENQVNTYPVTMDEKGWSDTYQEILGQVGCKSGFSNSIHFYWSIKKRDATNFDDLLAWPKVLNSTEKKENANSKKTPL